MAAAAWKARVLDRVGSAHYAILMADAGLQGVRGFIRTPASQYVAAPGAVAWVSALRLKLNNAMQWLTEVAQWLHSTAFFMEAAEILALHAGNLGNPSVPLPSIQHLEQAEPVVHAAMARLQIGRARAVDAGRFVECCRGHLSMAIALVDAPGFPDWFAFSDREVTTACTALATAMQLTDAAWADVTSALQFLTP